MTKRARDFSKLHHADPSGFWNLVRTGEKLPKPGDKILYVYDIRGSSDETFHELLVKISDGDKYKICRDSLDKPMVYEHDLVLAEVLKLPTEQYKPETRHGIVANVGFDSVLQEHFIEMRCNPSILSWPPNPDYIVYWAPMPTAPDTYTPRWDDEDGYYFAGQRSREQRVLDYLETRARRT
jgi:hypothetical protein